VADLVVRGLTSGCGCHNLRLGVVGGYDGAVLSSGFEEAAAVATFDEGELWCLRRREEIVGPWPWDVGGLGLWCYDRTGGVGGEQVERVGRDDICGSGLVRKCIGDRAEAVVAGLGKQVGAEFAGEHAVDLGPELRWAF
jgi:hypothetical protein